VESTGKVFIENQQNMDDKLDVIYALLKQWNRNDVDSDRKSHLHTNPSPTPPPNQTTISTLTTEELAFLKKQEADGKITIQHQAFLNTNQFQHEASTSEPQHTITPPEPRFVYIEQIPETILDTKPHVFIHNKQPHHHSDPTTQYHTNSQFSLSIACPKLDFSPFSREDPVNWLRQCERYFSLASVPMDT
jgi:hypothetical protein